RGPGGDPLGGMSTLQFGRQAFSSALAAERSAAGMFRNGLRPSGILKFDKWLTPEQRELVEAKLPEKYLGAINAGRPFIAEGGFDYQHISISPEDAQMLETRQFSVEEICRFFGVPPVMIGHPGGTTAWPTSVEQQGLLFQKFTLRRRIKRIEQAVAKQLLSPEDRAAGLSVRVNMEALLRGSSAERAAFYGPMT
ncbi:phage portal protein, partial [Rhodovulum viride]